MVICIIGARFLPDLLEASGLLLALGFGQGPGQAMNYGGIYELEYGFLGGKSFGLTVASMGFLCASIGGVIHMNYLKRKGKIVLDKGTGMAGESVEGNNEIPMQDSVDKLTVQVAIIAVAYMLAYILMYVPGNILPGMKSVIYGFNFILGVAAAAIVKAVLKLLNRKGLVRRKHTNDFLMTRCSNFFYDLMVVAGVAAIRLGILEQYWGVILALGVVGLIATYAYNYYVAKTLFPDYTEEQFLMMYGMLTGTASTGVILLREIDGQFKTPAADNLVYQNFPAIVFGFPMMLLATLAPKEPILTFVILVLFFMAMNIILFRSFIFKKKNKANTEK
jgi:ESS family glutamate:Na+ symporter